MLQWKHATRDPSQRPLWPLYPGCGKQSDSAKRGGGDHAGGELPGCHCGVRGFKASGQGHGAAEAGSFLLRVRVAIPDLPRLNGTELGEAAKIQSIQRALNINKLSFPFIRNTLLCTLSEFMLEDSISRDFLPVSALNSPPWAPRHPAFPLSTVSPLAGRRSICGHQRAGLCVYLFTVIPSLPGKCLTLSQRAQQAFVWLSSNHLFKEMNGIKKERIPVKLNSDKLSHKNHTCFTMNGFSITCNTKGVCRAYSGSSSNVDTILEA